MGHPGRLQSYIKSRARREIEVTRRRRGGIKRRENSLASIQFLIWFPQSGKLREIYGVPQRREVGGRRLSVPGGEEGKSKGERQI